MMARVSMNRFAAHSKKHFRGDPFYDLNSVTEGFAPRPDTRDDTELLGRICKAYSLSVSDSHSAPEHFQATQWWKELQAGPLAPVMRALESGDIAALRPMYANFFRDRCANGLVGIPYGMARAYFHGPMHDVHRHSYMGDALYRLNYWREQTGNQFNPTDLAGPAVGNPFGVSIGGTLVRSGSEYQHYCAHKILGLLGDGPQAVGEIGGGYGGIAYYLLRDGARIRYVDFDVPESIALTSYYLMRALPSPRFLLYESHGLAPEGAAAAEIALLPSFAMARIPKLHFDLTFSSHMMADLSDAAMAEYLNIIARMTRNYFVYFGDTAASPRIASGLGVHGELVEARVMVWHRHKTTKREEGEYVYRIRHESPHDVD